MKAISLCLSDFINEVYGFKINDILDGDYFCFDTSWVEADKEDVNNAKKFINEYNGLSSNIKEKANDNETLKEAIVSAKSRNYEDTYVDEYFESFKSGIEEKIIKDMENIQKLLADDVKGFCIEGKFTCKVNWFEDKIIFSGKLKVLQAIIVEVINSYGLFIYDSIEEFVESNEGSIKDRIDGHIAWLKETENIYCTIYNLFKFDTKFIDYHGTLGSDKLDMEILIDELEIA